MSVSTEVQRTLVKSPPELWTELGSTDGLNRHLGDLGEIRITAIEPETKVEWETDGANGVIQLKQSGWGTKVTLSLTREAPLADSPRDTEPSGEAEAEVEPEAHPEPRADTEIAAPEPSLGASSDSAIAAGAATETEPNEPSLETRIEPSLETRIEPEPTPERIELQRAEPERAEPARGESKPRFFARLFKRRRSDPVFEASAEPQAEPPAETSAAGEPAVEPEPEIEAMALPEPTYPDPPEPPEPPAETLEQTPDLASELAEVEAQMAAETTELLTGVLDRLGAAHHRPFSRG